ncbi:alpha/beta hydrolase [Belnapia sp. T18]|uniref:Alpha/beta hydrolase n=1 Tax=Belnapia arida TaxID=2804533 RepID=A0ABS1U8R9_9PROT|nr:alpha/beta hydrolase [Belnapia arida]MBL6079691.1 alpha/beta hydrolase [Belnapia arida]
MRRDIAFDAEGTILRGWLHLPDSATGPHAVVVMAHGFTGVKEQYLDRYAEVLAAAGLAVLVFDNRNFGASDGEPRGEIDPVQQVRDYRHAITYARTMPELDRGRVGAWGTSYSGGHVLMLGAIDRRVRCVVSQVPAISGPVGSSRRIRSDLVSALRNRFDADREARFRGLAPTVLPVVAEDPTAPCALPGPDAWAFFAATRDIAPAWRNEVTLRSAEMLREYEPGTWVTRISPTPLLMIVATEDTLTPTDLALDAYNRALEPKRLVLMPGGHFDPYTGSGFEVSSAAARDWFVQHLL